MFETLHRASFTVVSGQDENGKDIKETKYVTKTVQLPETLEDLAELTDNMSAYGEKTPFMVETTDPTVGYTYNQVTDEWARVSKDLPFWVAMAIEGYKLYVNAKIRPKTIDAGVEAADVEAYEKAGLKPHAVLIWTIGNAKAKKQLKDEILKWKATQS